MTYITAKSCSSWKTTAVKLIIMSFLPYNLAMIIYLSDTCTFTCACTCTFTCACASTWTCRFTCAFSCVCEHSTCSTKYCMCTCVHVYSLRTLYCACACACAWTCTCTRCVHVCYIQDVFTVSAFYVKHTHWTCTRTCPLHALYTCTCSSTCTCTLMFTIHAVHVQRHVIYTHTIVANRSSTANCSLTARPTPW